MNRLSGLDTLRGVAIVLMITFHISYDLRHFGYINIEITRDIFWVSFRIVIVSIFLFIVGVSLALAYRGGINWRKLIKRLILLLLSSIFVSLATYIIFPTAWVYFGIIHAIFTFTILSLPFINRGYAPLILAVVIFISYYFFTFNMHALFNIIAPILNLPKYHTVDLVSIIPWFSTVLIGVFVVNLKLENYLFNRELLTNNSIINRYLKILGTNSLIIYLIHQPILYLIFNLIQ